MDKYNIPAIYIGILLLIIEFTFEFDGTLGYCITTAGVLACIFGVVLSKTLRKWAGAIISMFL